jgi:hypothetical protein
MTGSAGAAPALDASRLTGSGSLPAFWRGPIPTARMGSDGPLGAAGMAGVSNGATLSDKRRGRRSDYGCGIAVHTVDNSTHTKPIFITVRMCHISPCH